MVRSACSVGIALAWEELGSKLREVVMYVLMFFRLQTAVDSIEHIDTVVSLGLEDKFYGVYEEEISKPFRWVGPAW